MRAYEGQDHDAHVSHLLFGTNQMILQPPMAMKLQNIFWSISLKTKSKPLS